MNKEKQEWKQIISKPKSITINFGSQVATGLVSYFELQNIIHEEIKRREKGIESNRIMNHTEQEEFNKGAKLK